MHPSTINLDISLYIFIVLEYVTSNPDSFFFLDGEYAISSCSLGSVCLANEGNFSQSASAEHSLSRNSNFILFFSLYNENQSPASASSMRILSYTPSLHIFYDVSDILVKIKEAVMLPFYPSLPSLLFSRRCRFSSLPLAQAAEALHGTTLPQRRLARHLPLTTASDDPGRPWRTAGWASVEKFVTLWKKAAEWRR